MRDNTVIFNLEVSFDERKEHIGVKTQGGFRQRLAKHITPEEEARLGRASREISVIIEQLLERDVLETTGLSLSKEESDSLDMTREEMDLLSSLDEFEQNLFDTLGATDKRDFLNLQKELKGKSEKEKLIVLLDHLKNRVTNDLDI